MMIEPPGLYFLLTWKFSSAHQLFTHPRWSHQYYRIVKETMILGPGETTALLSQPCKMIFFLTVEQKDTALLSIIIMLIQNCF